SGSPSASRRRPGSSRKAGSSPCASSARGATSSSRFTPPSPRIPRGITSSVADRAWRRIRRAGDIVSFTTKPEEPVRPVDQQIAEVARARSGVYTLERTGGAAPHPHERRLRELERLGLVIPEAPDRWQVPPNLLQELAERQRDAPVRHRLVVRKEPLSLPAQVRP